MNKSRIYQGLELSDVELIIKKAYDSDTIVNNYNILNGGLFNTTYLVNTLNPLKSLVLRVGPIRKELLFNYEKSMMIVEPLVYKLLEENGVPTPKIIECNASHEIIPRDYIILEYIEGIPLSHPSFPKEARSRIIQDLGAYTSKIHNIKSNTFGWITPENSIRGSKNWSDVIEELALETLEKAARYRVFDGKEINVFDSFFRKHLDLFNINSTPSLVHNDLWDPNIIVRKVEENWEIAAIVDADRALFADSEFEYVLWPNDPIFMKGYRKALDITFEGKLRRRAYSLLLSFMVAYGHKVQYDNKFEYESARNWALSELSFIKDYV